MDPFVGLSTEEKLIKINQRLLDSIDNQNWLAYREFVDPSITSFEPEGKGHLIEGYGFHQFYFSPDLSSGPKQSVISSPKVRLMGDVAIVTYIRLMQTASGTSLLPTGVTEETRVWKKEGDNWRNVHFHRSKPGQ